MVEALHGRARLTPDIVVPPPDHTRGGLAASRHVFTVESRLGGS